MGIYCSTATVALHRIAQLNLEKMVSVFESNRVHCVKERIFSTFAEIHSYFLKNCEENTSTMLGGHLHLNHATS